MKKNDKIILINKKRSTGADALLLDKIYTVKTSYAVYDTCQYYIISLMNEEGFYYSDNFIPLKKYRKQKLTHLNTSI